VQRMQLYRFSCVPSQSWFLYRIHPIWSWSCSVLPWQCSFSCLEAGGLAKIRGDFIHGVSLVCPFSRSIWQLFRLWNSSFLLGSAGAHGTSGYHFLSKYIFLFQERTSTVKVMDLRLIRSYQWDKWLYLGSLMTQTTFWLSTLSQYFLTSRSST